MARFTGPPLSSSQKTSENVRTFVKSTTAALASSCGPPGRQCMSDTITHVIPAVVPTHTRPSRTIASSRRR